MSYIEQQFNKAIEKGRSVKKEKARIVRMTPQEKVEVIKVKYGLTHGGSKQNKKKRKGQRRNK